MLARRSSTRLFIFLPAAVAVFALGLFAAQDKPDLDMMNRIRYEGLQHSQVGKLAAFLSDVIGPRPTGSPEIDRANKWTAAKMKEWGMTNVALEPYDDFGVGWALRYVSAHLIEPHYAPLIAISVEWGSSTKGKIVGQPLYVDIRSKDDFAKYKGKLAGRIVLYEPPKPVPTQFTPDAKRHDAASLAALAETPVRAKTPPDPDYVRGFLDELEDFFRAEEVGCLRAEPSGANTARLRPGAYDKPATPSGPGPCLKSSSLPSTTTASTGSSRNSRSLRRWRSRSGPSSSIRTSAATTS
jgi:hypothetical protein